MLDRAWHEANRLGQRATLDERIAWHLEHARECGCRDLPESIKTALAARNIPLPERRR